MHVLDRRTESLGLVLKECSRVADKVFLVSATASGLPAAKFSARGRIDLTVTLTLTLECGVLARSGGSRFPRSRLGGCHPEASPG
jgi:hypothetical protein